MAIKHKWVGEFNFRRQMTILYCFAYTERQAWAILCRRLARKDGVSAASVMGIFDGKHDNYEIKIEMEVKEIENPMVETEETIL
jgi:hypothetical protein